MSITQKLEEKRNINIDLYPDFTGKTLSIEISSGCNEKCIYCQYYAQGAHKKYRFIDDELFYRVTKEAKELGITDVGLYITGEPLTNPKVYDYVAYLKNIVQFDYVYISTNGLLLTPSNLVKLVDAGIDSIKFSVSGYDKESFLQHHGVDGFDLVYENIKNAYEYRKEKHLTYKLYMFSIITKYNEHYKEKFKALYEPYVDELVLADVMENGIKGVEKLLPQNRNSKSATAGLTKTIPCKDLFNRIAINQEGYLMACCYDTTSRMSIVEDLKKCSLKEAVYGERMVAVRKRHMDKNICHTICNYCVNGIVEEMEPFAPQLGFENETVSIIDISGKIDERFAR